MIQSNVDEHRVKTEVKGNKFIDRGDPYSTYDRRGGGVVVKISMKTYLGGGGVSQFRTYFFKAQKRAYSHT